MIFYHIMYGPKILENHLHLLKKVMVNFLLITIKNVNVDGTNVGFLAIAENANDVRAAINERKSFVIRTTFVLIIVILIFSFF